MRTLFKLSLFIGLTGWLVYFNYVDRVVKPGLENETIQNVFALLKKQTDDGKGLPKDAVQDAFGFAPADTRVVEGVMADLSSEPAAIGHNAGQNKIDFEVETYRFKRSMPFSNAQFVEVVYFNGAMFQAIANDTFRPADRSFHSAVIHNELLGNHQH